MIKAELILKKAELFERLSLYGDKHDYLRALAVQYKEVEDQPNMEVGYFTPPEVPPNDPPPNKPQSGPTTSSQAKNLIDAAKALVLKIGDNPYITQQEKNKLSWFSRTLETIPQNMYDASVHSLKGQIDNIIKQQV